MKSRSKFLTERSRQRRGRRQLPIAMAPHHRPFESARTACDSRGRLGVVDYCPLEAL